MRLPGRSSMPCFAAPRSSGCGRFPQAGNMDQKLMDLLATYGYLAVFVGSLLEGETVLILAGFAAHQGYLSFPLVAGVAFCGGTLGDQSLLFLGPRYRQGAFRRFSSRAPRAES